MKKNATFSAQDIRGNIIILESEEIVGKTERLSEKIKSLSGILIPAYTEVEVDFARKKPEDVAHDFMLKSLAPLLEQDLNNVDWQFFEEKTKDIVEQFFATIDWAKHTDDQDISIFVLATDQKTGKHVGVIQFLITPEFGQNNIKAALLGVMPSEHDRGLEKLLMSSIFIVRPDVKRIFLHTRSTNQQAILRYQDWGFRQYIGKLPNWIDLEYITQQAGELQKQSTYFVVEH